MTRCHKGARNRRVRSVMALRDGEPVSLGEISRTCDVRRASWFKARARNGTGNWRNLTEPEREATCPFELAATRLPMPDYQKTRAT